MRNIIFFIIISSALSRRLLYGEEMGSFNNVPAYSNGGWGPD
jgi:hypothetical protein